MMIFWLTEIDIVRKKMSKWLLRFFKSFQRAAEQCSAGLFNKLLFERESKAILRLKCESRVLEGEDRQIFLVEESGTAGRPLGKSDVPVLWPAVLWLCHTCSVWPGASLVWRDCRYMTHVGNEEKECGTACSGFVIQLCVSRSGVWVGKQKMWRKTFWLLFLCAQVFLNPVLVAVRWHGFYVICLLVEVIFHKSVEVPLGGIRMIHLIFLAWISERCLTKSVSRSSKEDLTATMWETKFVCR